MKKLQLEILRTISQIAFTGFVLVFVSAIFIKPPKQLFASLFFTAFISQCLYQLLIHIRDTKKIKSKSEHFQELPAGFYKITDNKTNTVIGELSNNHINFLRKTFLTQGMNDNDFYFLSELLDVFIHEEKPGKELTEFLKNAIQGKTEIELHWEPIKTR